MRRYPLTTALATVTALVVSLVAAAGAQAIVVNDHGTSAGLALVPGTCSSLLFSNTCTPIQNVGASAVTSSGPCVDPALTSDLGGPDLPSDGLCDHGGAVMHQNETFALTWDPHRDYWSGTRGYVEQFLRDVADGSGSLGSPYAVTAQYSDSGGRAQNSSVFGGGCIDYGSVGGSACEFGNPTGAGHDYPSSGCTPKASSWIGYATTTPNTICLTDAQLQGELSTMITQTGIMGRTEPGHTPLVVLLTPPGVETCLDPDNDICSANGSPAPLPPTLSASTTGGTIQPGNYLVEITYETSSGETLPSPPQTVSVTLPTSTLTIDSPAQVSGATGWYAYVSTDGGSSYSRQGGNTPNSIGSALTLNSLSSGGAPPIGAPFFCSYHSEVNVGGTEVAYVVQPWTPLTACDEPDAPPVAQNASPQQLGVEAGLRLVSPISQAQIAAITNPGLNGWSALDGSEINDNGGCVPLADGLDSVSIGGSSQNPYLLQREFNNAGVIESDPNTYGGCAPNVILTPVFVVPSSVNEGDEVQLDGSATASTLIVPNAGYQWSFGDGTSAAGPSVVHSYAKGGTYTVTLTVTDRGGDVRSLSQTIDVLGPTGAPVPTPTQSGTGSGGSGGGSPSALKVRLLLMPQGLRALLRSGISLRVSSNEPANGFVSVSVTRSAAKRAHFKVGRGPSVVIGQGTVSGITAGSVSLRLRLSKATVAKLRKLSHVKLSVRLSLVAPGGDHVAIDVAGNY